MSISPFLLSGTILISALCAACSLGEKRDILITTTPSKAKIYLDQHYVGDAPIVKTVNNRKNLEIYIDKDGYYPIDTEVIPECAFWGWVLWGPSNKKGLSLPQEDFAFKLVPLPKGITPKKKVMNPKKASQPANSPFSLKTEEYSQSANSDSSFL